MFWSIIELFLNFFSISVLKIFCWAGRKVSQYSTWDARMRAHISSPDPPGRIQVWLACCNPTLLYLGDSRPPRFYTLHSSGLSNSESGHFQSFKKVYYIIISVVCVCARACVSVGGHVWGSQDNFPESVLSFYRGMLESISCHQTCAANTFSHWACLADLFTFLLWNRRSYLNPAKNTDSFVLTGTWRWVYKFRPANRD